MQSSRKNVNNKLENTKNNSKIKMPPRKSKKKSDERNSRRQAKMRTKIPPSRLLKKNLLKKMIGVVLSEEN